MSNGPRYSTASKPHRPQLLHHLLLVRGRPVNAPASRAERKLLLRGKDIRRDFPLDPAFGYGLERAVAFRASGKRLFERLQAAGGNHLLELLAKLIAFDHQVIRRIFSDQAAIPRKDQSAFPARLTDQPIAG